MSVDALDGERHPLNRFVLAPDVAIDPVADLPADVRERLDGDPTDYVVTRPRTRTPSTLVDRTLAGLLERFRSPTSIVDAVLDYSATTGDDPRGLLDAAFGALGTLVADRLIVPAGSSTDCAVAPTLTPGDVVDGLRILTPVRVLDDTEVYRATSRDGSDVAIKLAGPGATSQVLAALSNEEAVLRSLDDDVAPRLIGSGRLSGRPWLATTWQHGSDLYTAAAQVRALGGGRTRSELLELGQRVLDAYGRLHGRGLLHVDIHPRNIAVDATGRVTLLDLGLAVPIDATRPFLAGGIDIFQAPEICAPVGGPVLPTIAAEIYSIGVLLYQVLTGQPTHAFSLRRSEMIRQLVEDAPLPFAAHGVTGLPETEKVLRRSLAKTPERRWTTVADFSHAFETAAEIDAVDGAGAPTVAGRGPHAAAPPVGGLGPSASRELPPPRSSVVHGAAGVAYALLRAARRTDDAALLARADVWASRATRAVGDPAAFWAEDLGVRPGALGRASLFHSRAGVAVVEALVAHGAGDTARQSAAVEVFLRTTRHPEHEDVLFGRAGVMLGAVALLDTCPPGELREQLRAHGDAQCGELWDVIGRQPPLATGTELTMLGMGHGWAGLLYATLTWCEASEAAAPDRLPDRLDQLAALGEPDGRCLRWPRRRGAGSDALLGSSWCNGAAGHVHLWAAAHRRYRDDASRLRALRSGWVVLEDSVTPTVTLCCGLAGRAYALARLAREFDDPRWLGRAAALLEHAPVDPEPARPIDEPAKPVEPAQPDERAETTDSTAHVSDLRPGPSYRSHSLFHGSLGLELARADIAAGGVDGMPFIEREGWPTGSGNG